jgi:hypothetical protein
VTSRRAVRFVVVVVAAAGLAIVAGTWAGSRLATPEESPAPPPPRTVSVGAAKLVVPAGWRPIPVARSGVPGLDAQRAVAFSRSSERIVVEFGPATDASLLPPGLRAAAPGSSSPVATRLAGRRASLYRGLSVGSTQTDVTVLATTAGVLAVACNGCGEQVSAAAVPGATTLVPSASLALALRLPPVVDRLDRSRRTHRAALVRARPGRRQGGAARRLAADHTTAAAALRPSAGAAGRPLLTTLAATATGYSALARAASNRWRNRFIAARQKIQRSEAALTKALADIPRPRAAPALRPKPAPAVSFPDIPAPGGVSLLVFALLALLAAGAGVALGTTGTVARLRQFVD